MIGVAATGVRAPPGLESLTCVNAQQGFESADASDSTISYGAPGFKTERRKPPERAMHDSVVAVE